MVRYYAHVLDEQTPQDSFVVAALLKDILTRVKLELPLVNAAYLRSDHAGCYHGSRMTSTIPHISTVTGIMIKRWDYSEPQSGKGPCDRAAAWIKHRVWDWVAENHPARTPEEFIDAANSYGGIAGVSMILGNVPPQTEKHEQFTIPDISKYYNFQFSETEITVNKAYNIGHGLKIPISTIEGRHLQSVFVKRKAYHEGQLEDSLPQNTEKYWKTLSTDCSQGDNEEENIFVTSQGHSSTVPKDADNADTVPDESNIFPRQLFSCPVDGCTKKFRKEANLARHVIVGTHSYALLRETAIDFAQNHYADALSRSNLQAISNAQQALLTSFPSEGTSQPRGWALKVSRPVARFNQKQREYLINKFEHGELTSKTIEIDTFF